MVAQVSCLSPHIGVSCWFCSSVQAGTQKPAKPQRREEEPMDATSQAEDTELSAERWVTDSYNLTQVKCYLNFINDD